MGFLVSATGIRKAESGHPLGRRAGVESSCEQSELETRDRIPASPPKQNQSESSGFVSLQVQGLLVVLMSWFFLE